VAKRRCKQAERRDDEVAEHVADVPVHEANPILRESGDASPHWRPPYIDRSPIMQIQDIQRSRAWRALASAGVLAATVAFGASASAATCPADKLVPDGKGQKMSTAAAKDVKDVVRSTTDLASEPVGVKGRQFRLRQLDIGPGGIVPWHSHDNRPAMIYIVSGEVVEYASNCAVPIVHKAGDVAPEKKGTSHWWQNTGSVPAVLISVDLFPVADAKMEHMM
jgi:quercetin dioxygenase-like cupin family protein